MIALRRWATLPAWIITIALGTARSLATIVTVERTRTAIIAIERTRTTLAAIKGAWATFAAIERTRAILITIKGAWATLAAIKRTRVTIVVSERTRAALGAIERAWAIFITIEGARTVLVAVSGALRCSGGILCETWGPLVLVALSIPTLLWGSVSVPAFAVQSGLAWRAVPWLIEAALAHLWSLFALWSILTTIGWRGRRAIALLAVLIRFALVG
jgi:hypothetical protein